MPFFHFQFLVGESPSPFSVWSVITRALPTNFHQLGVGKEKKNCKLDITVLTQSLVKIYLCSSRVFVLWVCVVFGFFFLTCLGILLYIKYCRLPVRILFIPLSSSELHDNITWYDNRQVLFYRSKLIVSALSQALQEAYRVLKPGGRFLCLEFSHVSNPLLSR